MKAAIAAAVLALAAAPAMAKPHAGRPSDILVSGGQIRASLGGSPNSAAYMTITNAGPKPDRLLSITCACAVPHTRCAAQNGARVHRCAEERQSFRAG